MKETAMRAIHIKDVHIPRSPNLFAFFVGEALWATIALFFFLVSWAVSGRENIQDLGGAYTLTVLLLGIAIGVGFAALTRPRD
jgi:hypothetical protein